MPYINTDGSVLKVIELRQAPADGHFFQLVQGFGFQEFPAATSDRPNPIYWAPPHTPSNNPGPGDRTDLASVPWVFWGFIASYGKQSAPAILHDHQSHEANQLPPSDALAQRRNDDRIFRVGLRQQKVPLLSAWLMWVFVSFERYRAHAPWRFALMTLQTIASIALMYAAIVLSVWQPWWLLVIVLPAIAALAWGRVAPVLLWGSYAGMVLAPLIALQIAALAPYWLLVILARELIDRPFIDRHPSDVIAPYFRVPH